MEIAFRKSYLSVLFLFQFYMLLAENWAIWALADLGVILFEARC